MRRLVKQYLLCTALAVSLSGCGAKHKEASQADLDASVVSLTEKVSDLCQTLASSEAAPNSQDIFLDDYCTVAKSPRSLRDTSKIGFSKLTDKKLRFDNGDEVLSLNSFTELWIGKRFMDMATRFKKILDDPDSLKAKQDDDELMEIEIDDDDIQVDKDKKLVVINGRMESSRTKNGFLTIKNDLLITAQLMDNRYIAINVETPGITPLEVSLFRKLKVMALVIPHASDFYLSIHIRLDLHSYSPGVDRKTRATILSSIEEALQKIPDFINEVE